ncbi:MAG TPA: TolC family protein [Ohtaekwangia sp.]|uniref:TolC family protein n=1 Tax=Ohtaekwangia sp. TaxID=2066019 RepID=UPI002F956BCE
MRTIPILLSCCWYLVLVLPAHAQADYPLTLEECYTLAEQNYPLTKQRELIRQSREYSVDNVLKGYLPQFSINGQASYQSDVTQIPIKVPGTDIHVLSKDQYKVYAEVNQVVYDGGATRQQQHAQEMNALVEEQKLDVELYKLRERINQLYFGVLLTDEQLLQNELLKNDINIGLKKTQAAIDNGTAFKSRADVLRAELLKANQRTTELVAMRKAYLDVLGLFLNRSLPDVTTLAKPVVLTLSNEIHRPELKLYDFQNTSIDIQRELISVKNRPRLSLFLQGGYGRPALNMLSNSFESYYIGGARLSWSLSGLYTSRKEKAILNNSSRTIQLQRETFLFNTHASLRQQNAEIIKLQQLLQSDDEIITLRESVKTAASAQLENGVIDTSDYLREVNAEDQSRQTKIYHQIQLLLAQYNQQTIVGNESIHE